MTTEIAVLNKQSVALAADSAVTTSSKVFQSANKIFSLSKVHPVGIMIFASAQFMGVPWETIIKLYRKELGSKSFPRLSDYAKDFLKFIETNPTLKANYYPEKIIVQQNVGFILDAVTKQIHNKVKKHCDKTGTASEDDIKKITRDEFDSFFAWLNDLSDADVRASVTLEDFSKAFQNDLDIIYENIAKRFAYGRNFKKKIMAAAYNYCTKRLPLKGYSGVVFAGFGDEEIFPATETYHIESLILGKVVTYRSSPHCAAISPTVLARLVGFAQDDMISMFMNGIHPRFAKTATDCYSEILKSLVDPMVDAFNIPAKKQKNVRGKLNELLVDIQKSLEDKLAQEQLVNFIGPTMQVVSVLPPLEVAGLAEAMVNLTTLQRQISSQEDESVGGPTDVALISKGDGFIWVKRKHYFDPELNPHFFNTYFRSCVNGKENIRDDI